MLSMDSNIQKYITNQTSAKECEGNTEMQV